MATTTYEPIISYTVPSNTTSITLGSGGTGTIPSTYTDLVLVIGNFGMDSGGSATRLRFNGDTGSNYSALWNVGTGSTAATSYDSNQTSMRIMGAAIGPSTSNVDTAILNIPNYSSASVAKTVLMRGSAATEAYSLVGLWRNTAAVTSITLVSYNGTHNILAGTTFTLYGITNANSGAKATGGIITYDNTYYYHTFGASGIFTPQQSLTNVDYLVIAGGGGGGYWTGGGGGAGGLRSTVSPTGGGGTAESKISLNSGTAYTITVGAGGNGGNASNATNGGTSSIAGTGLTTITSTGGGAGGGNGSGTSFLAGQNGGSGGGAAGNSGAAVGTGTANQGYNGSVDTTLNGSAGGGGGGAGSVATAASGGPVAGAGGNGVALSEYANTTGTGVATYYAGGGGGGLNGSSGTIGIGGLGGGGNGSVSSGNAGIAGVTNTGSGGGAGGGNGNGGGTQRAGGNGGSGVVIIRYPKA
jgi:hypothetical protein